MVPENPDPFIRRLFGVARPRSVVDPAFSALRRRLLLAPGLNP
ncbi:MULTISPECIES: hypothetical protein [Nocardia]|nr:MULTISPECIES: hypothetical protein [Nocardia]